MSPRSRPRRVTVGALTTAVGLLLLPLPWRAVDPARGPGTAWRLDGRLELAGTAVDPPGETLWLAAGRPQLLGERLLERGGGGTSSVGMIGASAPPAPAAAVPAAVAVARAAAGLDGPTDGVDARIAFRLGPVDLGPAASRLGLGDSNALAVAVAVLREAGATDLGTARVAATGRLDADGTVRPVGGVGPKARAAARAGAEVLLVPAAQAGTAERALASARTGTSGRPRVRPVGHLDELLPAAATRERG